MFREPEQRVEVGGAESRHPFQPPAPPDCCLEVRERPMDGTFDASVDPTEARKLL
jgi:hypothetical protein